MDQIKKENAKSVRLAKSVSPSQTLSSSSRSYISFESASMIPSTRSNTKNSKKENFMFNVNTKSKVSWIFLTVLTKKSS